MRSRYYIIEHPTRGCLLEIDPDSAIGARFSLLGRRSDPETTKRYQSIEAAGADIYRIRNGRVRDDCRVRAAPVGIDTEWRVVA